MGTAQIQGELWGARVCDWSELQEVAFRTLYESAFDAAQVGKGTALLDVGCGAGSQGTLPRRGQSPTIGTDSVALRSLGDPQPSKN